MTPDDVVKVLDFGLAKAVGAGVSERSAAAATFSSPAMTQAGIILGTAAYMSPEQARGKPVDARTDIWAVGCVLFEMLAARAPFDGETMTDVLGAIVHRDPNWTALPVHTPEGVRRLLARCLAKDAKKRLHSIADARLEIEELIAHPYGDDRAGEQSARAQGPARTALRERIAWTIAATASGALLVGAWTLRSGQRGSAESVAPTLRVSILPSEGGEVGVPAISPDGRRLAYSARRADGMPMIWVRDLDQSIAKPLAGTEEGRQVFWSPDSRTLGFNVANVLKRIPANGGPVQEIVKPVRDGATWGPGDVILYSPPDSSIARVSVSGGSTVAVTRVPGTDWAHSWPSFLPDGKHFLFTAKQWTGLAQSSQQGIYVGSLDDPSDARRLLPDLSNAVYAPPGFLVFSRDGHVMAARFDLETRQITGDPVSLGEDVAMDRLYFLAGLSAAADGTLAVRPPPAPVMAVASGAGVFEAELRLLSRDGTVVSSFGGVQPFTYSMAASPDGQSVAANIQDLRAATTELWRFDVRTGVKTPLTSNRSTGGWTGAPAWSPDGMQLAYSCQPPGTLDDVCIQDLRSGRVETIIASVPTWEHPLDWSPDGAHLLINIDVRQAGSRQELAVWSVKAKTLTPYVKASGNIYDAVFSPDGRFVAYTSTETGSQEVYITTFPERRQTWSLTSEGARVLSWRADGKEILVATRSGHITAYPVDTARGSFTSGPSQILIRNVGFDAQYSRATRDHSRILIRAPKDADQDRGEIRLLFGWQTALR